MDEKEFIQEYRKEKGYLKEWANIIKKNIIDNLEKRKIDINNFIKVPISIRIKNEDSIILKAFYRKKNYKNPLIEITDKVGFRIVVLFTEDINLVKSIIEENTSLWEYSLDRDYEKEREENPTIFDYQSVHYIIRNKNEINRNNIIIPINTPCEVQIRTLMQHAYSEVTHDTIYKPKKRADDKVYRLMARSMAMIETADSIFEEVDKMFSTSDVYKKMNINVYPALEKIYKEINKPEYNKQLNELIIDAYELEIINLDLDSLVRYFNGDNFDLLKIQINKKYNEYLLFRQSIIILIFYLVDKCPDKVKNNWPIEEEMIKPIYTGLGISFDKY